MKFRILCMAAALMMCLTAAGCSDKNPSSESEITSLNTSESVSESTSEKTKSTETSKKTTVKKTTTTTSTKEYKIKDIDASALSGYSFSVSGFEKITSEPDFYDYLGELQDVIDSSGFGLSFSYENMDTGASINYNSNVRYPTCSTIKTPYVKWLLESGAGLDERVIKKVSWSGDSGIVAKDRLGTKYSLKQLIKYTIQRSDNSAYYNLVNTYGYWEFNSYLNSLGANYALGSSWIFTYCTSSDMLKCYKDIYKYTVNTKRGKWLKELLQDTDVNRQIGKALDSKYQVSQKYGSDFTERQYHDCAIVYADSPFVLCIFTNQYPETESSDKVFIELSKIIDKINTIIYVE